jgi:hypothetical protein
MFLQACINISFPAMGWHAIPGHCGRFFFHFSWISPFFAVSIVLPAAITQGDSPLSHAVFDLIADLLLWVYRVLFVFDIHEQS